MVKNFCDRCGKEITCDIEIVFGYELCEKCQEALSNWLENKPSPDFPIYPEIDATSIEEDYQKAIEGIRKYAKSSPNLLDKEDENEDEYEKIFAKGDKRAIAHFKMKHGYTLSKEDLDILEEDRVNKEYNEALKGIKSYAEKKDPCAGLTCYSLNGDGSYTLCPELTTETDPRGLYRYYNCQKKGTGIAIPERDIVYVVLVIEPKAFNGEEF